MILNVDKVTKSFGTRVLFSNVSFRINERDRYALVGPNGAGKTTLMNIIAGLESADEGQVVFSRDAHPGYLEQESIEMEGRSVLEEVMTKIMYSVPSDPTIVKVTITASCVTDGADPEIVRDPERRQRPRLGKASLRAERGGAVGTNAG